MAEQSDPPRRWDSDEDSIGRVHPRGTPEEGVGYTGAIPELARSTLGPSTAVGALGGIALVVWGITWLSLGRWLGIVLLLLGIFSLAAVSRIAWKALRARRGRSAPGQSE